MTFIVQVRLFSHEKTGLERGGGLAVATQSRPPGCPHMLLSLDHVEGHPGSTGEGTVPVTDLPRAVLKGYHPVSTDRCTGSGRPHD